MIELLTVIKGPHITEKTTQLKELAGSLCFKVATNATKVDVRRAVERLFSVKVDSVRVVNSPAKRKRFRNFVGFKPAWRKAYVKLKPGHSIEYFEGM